MTYCRIQQPVITSPTCNFLYLCSLNVSMHSADSSVIIWFYASLAMSRGHELSLQSSSHAIMLSRTCKGIMQVYSG